MVEINDEPRIKLSQEVGKVTIPGRKDAYRLYGSDGYALIDLLQKTTEEPPQVMQKVLCRHPFQQTKRANVTPSRVEPLHKVIFFEIIDFYIVLCNTYHDVINVNKKKYIILLVIYIF